MQDASEQQNNAQLNQVLQSSSLSQRLARRSTESVGVVYLKPFQSQYVRMPGWMVQRSMLLEQLQTRYGTRKEGTGETSDMVLASVMPQPPQAQLNSPTLPLSLGAMPQPTAPIRGKLPTPPSPSPPSTQFRVSRRVALPPDTSSSPKVTSSSASEAKTSENSGEAGEAGGGKVSSLNTTSDETHPQGSDTTPPQGVISSSLERHASEVSPDTSEQVLRSQILPDNITDKTPPSVPKISEIGSEGGAEVSLVWRQVSPEQSEKSLNSELSSSSSETPTQTSRGDIIASEAQSQVSDNKPQQGRISSTSQSHASEVSPDTSEQVLRSQILPNNITDKTPPSVPKISEIGSEGEAEVSLVLRKVTSVQSEELAEPLIPTTEQPSNFTGNPTPTSEGNAIASEVQPQSSSSVSLTDAIASSSPKLESPVSMPGIGTEGTLVLRKAASIKLDESLGQSIAGKSQLISNSQNSAASGKFPISRAEISTQSSNLRGVEGTNPQGFHAGVALKTNVPLILRQAVSVKPDELSQGNAIAKTAILPSQVKEIEASSTRTQSPETLPLVQTASTSMRLQLRQEHSSTAIGIDTPNSQRMAVAAEIPIQKNSVSQTGIVWRKSANESSSAMPLGSQFSRGDKNALPLAINLRNGNEQIARQFISASSSMPETSTAMENSMSADAGAVPRQVPTSASEVNVAQIAEQVSRILSRQLIVERERRGIN